MKKHIPIVNTYSGLNDVWDKEISLSNPKWNGDQCIKTGRQNLLEGLITKGIKSKDFFFQRCVLETRLL